MRKTLMIFGGSSFVGANLIEELKKEFRIVATYFETPVLIPGILTLKCDVLKKDLVTRLIAQFRPDYTLYAGGLSSLIACHAQPKLADAVNSAGLINVCSAAERYSSKFICLSSSYVLGGEQVRYKESYTPFPATVYGSTLASSEFYVQKSCLNYLCFRLSPLIGRGYHPVRKNWFEFLETQLASQTALSLDDHVYHGFYNVKIFAKILSQALQSEVTNRLFQIGTTDVMTRYEFAQLYCKIYKKDLNLISRSKWLFPLDDGPGRMSKVQEKYYFQMDLTNASEFFNVKMPTIEESLLMLRS
jgi:dTDP-4-dehydrorhamnose reductase